MDRPLVIKVGGVLLVIASIVGFRLLSEAKMKYFYLSWSILVFGLYIFYLGFRALNVKRIIENTPTSKIRSVAMGPVEIFGKAVPKKTLLSPILQKPCVYYNTIIRERRGTGKYARWVTIYWKTSDDRFFVRDDTGYALVDPKDAEIEIEPDLKLQTGIWGNKIPKEVEDFAKRENINLRTLSGIFKNMVFSEQLIAPNDEVYVFGTATENPDVKNPQKGYENILIKKGDAFKFFYISDKPEKTVLSRYGRRIKLFIPGGAILIVGGFIGLLLTLGVF